MRDPSQLRRLLQEAIAWQGFSSWGVARAEPLPEAHARLREWIASGRHGFLGYMERSAHLRAGPGGPDFLPGARSVVMVSLAFSRPDPPPPSLGRLVARHARGLDYHDVVGARLRAVLSRLEREVGDLHGRVFVDSAPVMEKPWAQRAGLGWIGLNGLLVQPGLGTWCVLGGIAIDGDIEPDASASDGCGDCRACVDACPVGALSGDRLVDVRRCLSGITVERRGPLDREQARSLSGRMAFGCDLCQEACPHNAVPPAGDADFEPLRFMKGMTGRDFLGLDAVRAGRLLEGTSLARAGAERFKESIEAALG